MESRTKVKIVTNLNIQTPSGKLNCNKLRNLCKNELKTNYIDEAKYQELNNSCSQIRVMLIKTINTAKRDEK